MTLLYVPPAPGMVYRHLDPAGLLLYVGSCQARHLRDRHAAHARQARWWRYVARIEHEIVLPDRRAAYLAEAALIRAERPVFNRSLRSLLVEQEAREAAYVTAHAHLDLWPEATRFGRQGLSREQLQEQTDAMLLELGVRRVQDFEAD
jgi:excinuclease UvrABC nuclease subunit